MKQSIIRKLYTVCFGLLVVKAALPAEQGSKAASRWLPIVQDELHDPAGSAAGLLQNPGEALSKLPRDGSGDQVNWVKALEKGYIRPYASIQRNSQPRILDLDVLRKNTADMDMVLFPHKQHTEWMSCDNCHEGLFKSKAGATKFGMFDILNGEYCGRCHGAVAFPLTECVRCHNAPRTPIQLPGAVK